MRATRSVRSAWRHPSTVVKPRLKLGIGVRVPRDRQRVARGGQFGRPIEVGTVLQQHLDRGAIALLGRTDERRQIARQAVNIGTFRNQ